MFGLKPWDADGDNPGSLTWGELHEYLLAADEHDRHMEALADDAPIPVRYQTALKTLRNGDGTSLFDYLG